MTPLWKRPEQQDPFAHLDSLLRLAPDGVIGVNESGEITVVNRKAEKMLASPHGELVGKPIESILPDIFSTDLLGPRTEYLSDPSDHSIGSGPELIARRLDAKEFPVVLALTALEVSRERIVLLFARDISARRRAEELADQRAQEIKELGQRMIIAQEEDRARIARDLHDDISQRLHAAAIGIDAALRAMAADPDDGTARLRAIQERLDGVAQDTRKISHELHPPTLEILGLASAIEGLCEDFEATSGATTKVSAPESVQAHASPEVALGIYRIAQEALRNTAKHAQAHNVSVELSAGDASIELRIRDDGVGFDPGSWKSGLGLASMRERARLLDGTLTVHSAPAAGTELVAELPRQLPHQGDD